MAKKNKKYKSKPNVKLLKKKRIKEETSRSVWALILISIASVLVLASFNLAGKGGEMIYEFLFWLLGWGYVFLPIALLGAAVNFLLNRSKEHLYGATFWGILLFIFSILGFIDVVAQKSGGVIGEVTGYPKHALGDIGWGVVTFILTIAGVLITLDQPLYLKKKKEEKIDTKKEAKIPPIPKSIIEKEKEEKKKTKKAEEIKEIQVAEQEEPEEDVIKTKTYQNIDEEYVYPPVSLLNTNVDKPTAGDLKANASIIQRTLESFGIPVEMGEINIGPKVTRYTLRPAEGVKLSKITALNQDLSLALAAHPIRIEAPIPGKPYVGIEVPNKTQSIVRLGSLMLYPEFKESKPLTVPIGKDVTGKPIFADIEKMPHLLIAGATGSGKSITLHSILISLLYKNSPSRLNMILIDPKRVELSHYSGLPHLLSPVVTSGKRALSVFRWAIDEMERRYDTFLEAGARDIQSYNKKNGYVMPYILIVVDEMADLMAAYGHDVENAIVRLAQMARATGIHLILSTQRPSVEVITGLIKANITARIALQVASQVDSRTILDSAGAEKLLGGGDLLFISSEFSKPKRIQGAFVSEDEIKKVTEFIKKNNRGYLPLSSADIKEEDADKGIDILSSYEGDSLEDEDELLPDAIELVKQTKKASASFLQRKLKVGYARAARLLDMMEERGIVGPADGAKPREVYIVDESEFDDSLNIEEDLE